MQPELLLLLSVAVIAALKGLQTLTRPRYASPAVRRGYREAPPASNTVALEEEAMLARR
jgi:hypothetical protein